MKDKKTAYRRAEWEFHSTFSLILEPLIFGRFPVFYCAVHSYSDCDEIVPFRALISSVVRSITRAPSLAVAPDRIEALHFCSSPSYSAFGHACTRPLALFYESLYFTLRGRNVIRSICLFVCVAASACFVSWLCCHISSLLDRLSSPKYARFRWHVYLVKNILYHKA